MAPDAQAIQAAAVAEREWKRRAGLPDTETGYDTGRIRVLLEAAAPHLAAAYAAALERHTHWFTNGQGAKLCGGCLAEYPCPDTALLRKDRP